MKALIALLFVFHAAAAVAEDRTQTNWYLLLSAGLSNTKTAVNNDATLAAQGFGVLASRDDSGAASLGFGAGYRLSRRFALELSYLDFSQLHYYSATYTTGSNFGTLSKQWQASGIEAAAVGMWPLGESLSIIGKVGVLSLDGKYRTTTTVNQPNGALVSTSESSASGSSSVPGFGLGFSYTFAPKLNVRAVYEGWNAKSGTFGPGNDLDRIRQFLFSLVYRL